MQSEASSSRGKPWLWLLLIPFIAVLWVPSYNRSEPSWLGLPFFYWYQLAWVLITAVLTAWVYLKTAPGDDTTGGQS
jgi:hypothetical protein